MPSPNLGQIVNVVTWFLLVTSTLAILTRLLSKRAVQRRWGVDDGLAVASLLFSIGSGVAVSVQAANGLGATISTLESMQLGRFSRSAYAASLLYLTTLCLAKLSIAVLLRFITPSRTHQIMGTALLIFIASWGVVSLVAFAFQCDPPRVWDSFGNKCFNRTSFWRSMGVINILTDLALIALPIHIVQGLQMALGKKAMILSCFGSRLFDVAATIVQLAYTSSMTDPNVTLAIWKWTMTTQIVQCITIITSCVPYLRPLLEGLQSGMYMSDELRRRGMTDTYGYEQSGSEMKAFQITEPKSTSYSSNGRSASKTGFSQSQIQLGLSGTQGETSVSIASPSWMHVERNGTWDTGSDGSDVNIIKTTTMSTGWPLNGERRDLP